MLRQQASAGSISCFMVKILTLVSCLHSNKNVSSISSFEALGGCKRGRRDLVN